MIIKGQYKTFGFWISLLSVIGGLCVFLYYIINGAGNTPIAGQICLYSLMTLLVGLYGKQLYDANQISIDTDFKTITFINLFTRQKSIFHFDDFDGKLVWDEPIKGGTVRKCFLIQDRRAKKKISGFIYSNHLELEKALTEIKDFGKTNYSYLKSVKVLFGYPIID